MRSPHDRRLRGAGALRRGRGRVARARARRRSCAPHGYVAELVSAAVQVVPEGRDPARTPRRGGCSISARATAGRSTWSIGTKFPSYFVRHPNKVAWLIHQYRAAYELCGTEFSDFDHIEGDVGLRAAPDRARPADARRVPARLHQRREHRRAAGEVQRPRRRAAVSSAASGATPGARAVRRLRAVRRPDRERSSGSTSPSRRWLTSTGRSSSCVAGDGHAARQHRARWPRSWASPIASASSAPWTTRRCSTLYADALAVVYRAVRRGLRLRDARSVPRPQAGRHCRPTRADRSSSSRTA